MDRLTREKIERIRRTGVSDLYEGDIDALCNDLEELQRLVKLLADLAVTEPEIEQEFAHGPRVIFEKGGQITVRDVLMARKALKREPNAAGWNEKGIADIGVLPGEVDATAEPAPAAPDVAEMVRRLNNLQAYLEKCLTSPTKTCEEAAALLAKLGQRIETRRESEHPSNYEFPPAPGASDD